MSNLSEILAQVKQGNSKAIAMLINHIFKGKNIKITKILVKEDYWQIMLESEEIPQQIEIVSLLEKSLTELKIDTIKKVKIYGKKKTEVNPLWQTELLLPSVSNIEEKSNHFEAQLVKVEIADQSQLQLGLRARAKSGDLSAITELLNNALARKNIKTKLVLQNNCLQILLESELIGNQEDCVRIIKREMLLLKVPNIEKIHIYAKKIGDDLPTWDQELNLKYNIITVKSTPVKSLNMGKIALYAIPILSLIILIFSSLSLRIYQQKKINEANQLSQKIKVEESSFDTKSFEDSRKNLQDATLILEEIPTFPLPFTLAGEVKKKVKETNEQIKVIDQKIVTIQNLKAKIKTVADTFFAIDSSLDVGINYRDYTDKVRELKVQLDSLSRENEAIKHPIYSLLEEAFKHYDFAKNVWEYYIESDESHHFLSRFSVYGSKLVSEYGVETTDIVGTEYIYLDIALAQIWAKAHSVLEEVQSKI